MRKMLLIAIPLLVIAYLPLCAQQNNWEEYYHAIVDGSDDDDDDISAEMLYEVLAAHAATPYNINALTRSDLEELLFLSNEQIDAILEYIERYGPILSKAELMMLPSLDVPRRNLLACLTTVGDMPPREKTFLDSLRYDEAKKRYRSYDTTTAHGDVAAYIKIPFYTRRGDENGYYGYQYKHWLRINYTASRHVRVGAIAAQDAGEPFFANKNKYGYDYYTAFLQLRNIGIIKNLVVGHYRIKMGLGLIMNNNISFGHSFGITSAQSSATVIRPHNSRSESNYLQGAALTLALSRHGDITLFASYRKIDATLNDSTSIRTILSTGYHRTASELARKHNAAQTIAGVNIRYTFGAFNVGVSGVYDHYSLPLQPYAEGSSTAQLYRRFYPTGQDFWNISVNYGYRLGKRLRIEGETGTGDSGMVATVNTLSWRMNSALTLYAVYRYYPVQFTAPLGDSFSNNSSNQNEHGIYAGATWTPSSRLSLEGYADYAYYKWAKYLILGASHSFDARVQVAYNLSPHTSLTARYRFTLRQRNGTTEGTLINKTDQRLRVAYKIDLHHLSLNSQVDAAYSIYRDKGAGVMLSETARYTAGIFSCHVGIAYFNTHDYWTRLYTTESSLPYSYTTTALYGHGMRGHILATVTLHRCTLTAKTTTTRYFHRHTTSSSYQTITSKTQSDLEILLRYAL